MACLIAQSKSLDNVLDHYYLTRSEKETFKITVLSSFKIMLFDDARSLSCLVPSVTLSLVILVGLTKLYLQHIGLFERHTKFDHVNIIISHKPGVIFGK